MCMHQDKTHAYILASIIIFYQTTQFIDQDVPQSILEHI